MSNERKMEYKLVIVVRDDIKISPGKMAAQVGHAAVECSMRAKATDAKLFSRWMDEGQRKVVLKVANLPELERIEGMARGAGLIISKIADAGLTEVPPGTVTCVGIGPSKETDIDRITGNLKLA